jgi:hypothetical protein
LADIVAKRFWTSVSATFIQDEPLTPMLIQMTCSLRFDCCAQVATCRLLRQYRPDPEAPALDVLQVRSGSIHLLNRT